LRELFAQPSQALHRAHTFGHKQVHYELLDTRKAEPMKIRSLIAPFLLAAGGAAAIDYRAQYPFGEDGGLLFHHRGWHG
jgi:hypothetical protein